MSVYQLLDVKRDIHNLFRPINTIVISFYFGCIHRLFIAIAALFIAIAFLWVAI